MTQFDIIPFDAGDALLGQGVGGDLHDQVTLPRVPGPG